MIFPEIWEFVARVTIIYWIADNVRKSLDATIYYDRERTDGVMRNKEILCLHTPR
jgi:hypothetical protein